MSFVEIHMCGSGILVYRDSVGQQNWLVQQPWLHLVWLCVFLCAPYLCVSAPWLSSAAFLISLQLVPQMKHVFHLLVFYLLRKGVRVSTFWFPGALFCTKLLVPALYFLLSVAKMCSIVLRTEECFQCCMMSRSIFSPVGFLCLEKLPLLFFFWNHC